MRTPVRIILIVLAFICSVVAFSQKKTQLTPQQRKENAIQYAFDEMQNSLKRGDYEKAYGISSRLNKTLNSFEKRQVANNIEKQAKKLITLRYEAYTALRDKNYTLAMVKYDSILKANPTDNITKSDKVNLIAIINYPKNNVLDKVLVEADNLFNEAIKLDIKGNTDEIEEKLSKARKIWTVVAKTSPNYQKAIVEKNIAAVNDILKNSNDIRIAIKNGNIKKAVQLAKELEVKYPEFNSLPTEIIRDAKENQKKYIVWKQEAEEAFCNLDYPLVLKKINTIKQMPGYQNDSYVKTNGRRLDVKIIQDTKEDINKIKNDFGRGDMIIEYYEKIFQKNPCDKEEYFAFVKEQLSRNSSYAYTNNCNNTIKYGMILLRIDEQQAISDGVKAQIDDCDKQLACLDKCRNIYLPAYTTALQLKNQGKLSDAEARLNSDIINNRSAINDCKCDSILQKANDLLADINTQKKWIACIDIAKNSLTSALDSRGKSLFNVALETLNTIDTTCLVGSADLLSQIKTTRKKLEFEQKEQLYIMLRDSALAQEDKEYYKDLFILLGNAKAVAPDSARSAEINHLIIAKCCLYKNIESNEKEVVCSFCEDDCCPPPPAPVKESSPIKKIEIVVGGNITFGQILLSDAQNNGKYSFENNFGGNFGVRYQRNNYKSMIDWRIGINLSYNTVSFNPLAPPLSSGLIQGDFSVLGLDTPFDLKWHRKKSYHDDLRYYLITGLHLGKNNVIKTISESKYQSIIKSNLNTFYTGFKVGLGLDYNIKKWGLSLELDYRMKGNIYENSNFSSPFNSSAKFNTINVSIGFRVW